MLESPMMGAETSVPCKMRWRSATVLNRVFKVNEASISFHEMAVLFVALVRFVFCWVSVHFICASFNTETWQMSNTLNRNSLYT